MSYGSVNVLTTATLIVPANARRRSVSLVNNSESTVFIGPDTSILTTDALPLFSMQTRDETRDPETWLGPIYGIVDTGTAEVRWWEVTN